MKHIRFAVAAAGMIALAAAPAAAQDYNWQGTVAAGSTIEIKGVNGSVHAVAASGSQARVTATKTSRRGDVETVRIEMIAHSGGITVCAVYPSQRGRPENECAAGRGGRMNVQNNDVQVHFEVQVPAGVNFVGRTVNGNVEATGITGSAAGHTVNGSVRLDAMGVTGAQTVNGGINVTIGRADWRNRLELETVNGGITVTFAGDVHTEVSATTVNGGIDTDYPLQVVGRFGPRRVNGTIGNGGRSLVMTTVNGGISIKRR